MMAIRENGPHLREVDLAKKVAEKLEELLKAVPFMNEISTVTGASDNNLECDLVADVRVNSKRMFLIVEVKAIGQPRNVRQAISQLQMVRRWSDATEHKHAYCMFAAPFVSESAREICREAGFGYIDLTGNCLISFNNVYIERFGFQKDAEKRELRSVFNDKASRIVRRLLTNPSRPWFVQDLAKQSHVSIGLASQVKTKLFNGEFLERRDEQFVVSKPVELLKDWADSYKLKFKKHLAMEFYSPKKLQSLEEDMMEYFQKNYTNYAFTLASAAKAIGVQYVSQVNRIHAYVDCDVTRVGRDLGLKQVDSGGNVVLMQPFDSDVLYLTQSVSGLHIVSNLQLYLDFSAQKGRIQETADIIFDTQILPRWEDLSRA